jgi:hypothetical protein
MTIPSVTWKIGDRMVWNLTAVTKPPGDRYVTEIEEGFTHIGDWKAVHSVILKFWTLIPSPPTFKILDRVKRTSHDLGPYMVAGKDGVVESVGSVDILVRTDDGRVTSYPINGGYWELAPVIVSDEPMLCAKCGDGFPMAVANQPNGSMVCWSCRNRR